MVAGESTRMYNPLLMSMNFTSGFKHRRDVFSFCQVESGCPRASKNKQGAPSVECFVLRVWVYLKSEIAPTDKTSVQIPKNKLKSPSAMLLRTFGSKSKFPPFAMEFAQSFPPYLHEFVDCNSPVHSDATA